MKGGGGGGERKEQRQNGVKPGQPKQRLEERIWDSKPRPDTTLWSCGQEKTARNKEGEKVVRRGQLLRGKSQSLGSP